MSSHGREASGGPESCRARGAPATWGSGAAEGITGAVIGEPLCPRYDATSRRRSTPARSAWPLGRCAPRARKAARSIARGRVLVVSGRSASRSLDGSSSEPSAVCASDESLVALEASADRVSPLLEFWRALRAAARAPLLAPALDAATQVGSTGTLRRSASRTTSSSACA